MSMGATRYIGWTDKRKYLWTRGGRTFDDLKMDLEGEYVLMWSSFAEGYKKRRLPIFIDNDYGK